MKKSSPVILFVILSLLIAWGHNAFAQKDSAAAPVQTKKAATNEISDEELILDEPSDAIVPATAKTKDAAATTPAPVQPAAAAKPPVSVPANTAPKPATVAQPKKDTISTRAATVPVSAPKQESVAVKDTANTNAAIPVDTAKKQAVTAQPQKDTVKAATIPVPAPQKEAAAVKDTAPTVVDEELILDGGAEDLLGHEKPVPVKSATKKDSTAGTDSSAMATGSVPDSSITAVASDSATTKAATDSSAGAGSVTPLPQQVAAQTKIEKVRSINFGANLKEYRSPKLAMLMSLILPGSGQVYAKSNWIAAGFLAVEAAVFGTGYAFIAKSKSMKKDAHKFADSLYDPIKYQDYSEALKNYLTAQGNEQSANSIIIDSIFFSDSAAQQTFLENAQQKNDAFYDNIQSNGSIFVRGWTDVEPDFNEQSGFGGIDTSRYHQIAGEPRYLVAHKGDKDLAFGFSDNQATYFDMIEAAQSKARVGRNFYLSLLVNHLASAVIAGIVAKKHNDELLGEESVWRRIDVEQNLVNTGSHTVNGYALGISF
jgi:hypothetical protein